MVLLQCKCMAGQAVVSELHPGCAGFIFASMACTSLVITQPAAWLADRYGRKAIIMPSCLGVAASIILMAVFGAPSAAHHWLTDCICPVL